MYPENMVSDTFIIEDVLRREGRGTFTDRQDDRGGATRWGISLAVLQEWRGRDCAAQDVAELTEAEARDIYRYRFLGKPRFDTISDVKLRWLLVDCGVLHGTDRATRWLQEAVGAKQDGVLGDETRRAVWRCGWKLAFLKVCALRVAFIGRIVTGNTTDADHDGIPDNMEMAAGWLARAASFLEEAA